MEGFELLQIQYRIHVFLLSVLNPFENTQILSVQIRSILLLPLLRTVDEGLNDGLDDGI